MTRRLLRAARSVGRLAARHVVIHGYDEFCQAAQPQRALLSYLVHPLLPPPWLRDRVKFSPFGIAQQIPRALNELGYIVDIVNFDNIHWSPRASYDLFITHGGVNFARLADGLASDTVKIYFASGLYWREANARVEARLRDLADRTGCRLEDPRRIEHGEDAANRAADGIVYLGNRRVGNSFAPFKRTHGIDNAAYDVTWDGWRQKDYAAGRQHFLYYQGPGNVQKGLDLALEAFEGSPLHLHVCQDVEPTFARAYQRLLQAPNIHVYQAIRPRSAVFYQLASRCNWVLSASASEGQPGSVIEMMAHGLIPVLGDDANIDLGEWGIRLVSCSVADIKETCAAASVLPAARCACMAAEVVDETRVRYSVAHFRASFRAAVSTIVADVAHRATPAVAGARR